MRYTFFGLFLLLALLGCRKEEAGTADTVIGVYEVDEQCYVQSTWHLTTYTMVVEKVGPNTVSMTNYGHFNACSETVEAEATMAYLGIYASDCGYRKNVLFMERDSTDQVNRIFYDYSTPDNTNRPNCSCNAIRQQ